MPTNFYFNNAPTDQITSEQLLVEDLVIEAMQIHGLDVYYLPRTSRDSVDMLYGEDTLKQYVTAYPIEMYLENVTGMDGEGDFISKFAGIQMPGGVTLDGPRIMQEAQVEIDKLEEEMYNMLLPSEIFTG